MGSHQLIKIIILCLAGMEIAFFTAAHGLLCFLLVTKTMFIRHHTFSYC